MNAITNKSRILCLVFSMFMLHVPFYSFLSIYFSSQLNANLHDFQRLLYWTVSAFAFALHLTLLPLSVSSVETGLNLLSAFAFKHFWLTLKWQCAYTIFSNWLEFQWKHIIILYIEFEWAWAMRWWWWWRRWWVCIYSFISLDQNSFIWPEWKQSSQNCVQGCVCVFVCANDRRMICWAAVFWLFWYLLSQIIDPICLMLSLPMGKVLHFIIASNFNLLVK